MCGLIGVFGSKLTVDSRDFVRDGLVADMLRGFHSTGLLSVNKDGDAAWYKDAVKWW